MSVIFHYLLIAASVVTALPIVIVFVECAAALLPRRKSHDRLTRRPRVDVLIPAHDEETVLADTLASVTADLRPGDRVLVVADNCSDLTADIARCAGVEVVERTDPVSRGKGFALDFGFRRLAGGDDDVVVIVDADCRVAPGSLDALARTVAETGRAAQAEYVMTCPPAPTPRDIVSQLAVIVKNRVRQRGLTALGAPCVLTGSGMAFPRGTLAAAALAGGDLVEDMKLSYELSAAGRGPVFCPEAVVVAPLPQAVNASRAQRTRWEHGHLQTLLRQAPRLLAISVGTLSPSLFVAAVDLAVPPLSLLVIVWSIVAALSGGAWLVGGPSVAAMVSAVSGGLLATAVLVAQVRFGRGSRLGTLTAVPQYVAGKLPIYAAFVVRRQQAWVRTDREAETPRPAGATPRVGSRAARFPGAAVPHHRSRY
jgi:cellulose synthase/poly-beta-1,6-N-acetylglucosamine synthase-like glycosyltransferase